MIFNPLRKKPNVFVFTGSEGGGMNMNSYCGLANDPLGKTFLSRYLFFRLLLQKKPVMVLNPGGFAYFYCDSGVFLLREIIAEHFFLTGEDNESARSITILIDAGAVPDHPRRIPLAEGLHEKLGPTMIFFSSPQLSHCSKKLAESLPSHHSIHVMNPWTGFELELL